jgi:type I restriction enzyme S subunit
MFESIKLGQIVSISKGRKHNLLEYKTESSKRYIQIDDLRNNLNLKYTDDKKGILVTDDDVIIAWDGANAGTVGYNLNGLIGSTLAVLRNNNPKEYNPQYLALFLQSKFSYLRARTTGATIPHLHRKTLESLKIPKISIDNQVKIANLLTQVEELISKRKESIVLLDELLKSSFLDMFIFNKNKLSWKIHTLLDLAKQEKRSMRTGPFGSNLLHDEFTEEGDVAVLGIDNAVKNKFVWAKKRYITHDKYQELTNYTIYPEDVIITIMGTVGRSAVVPKNIPLAINTKHLAAISLNQNIANPYFIAYSIHSNPEILSQIKNKTRGAIMGGFNLGLIKKLKLSLPPKPLQDKFATIVQQVEVTKTHYQESLDELNELFGSLSQRAFRGELDLSKINMPVSIKISDAKALDAPSSSGAVDLKEILDVPVFMRKQMDEEEVTTATYTDRSNNPVYDEDFLWMILQQSDDDITFEIINKKLEKFSFREYPNYDQVQEDIFSLILQKKLSQYFDRNEEKIILSRVL